MIIEKQLSGCALRAAAWMSCSVLAIAAGAPAAAQTATTGSQVTAAEPSGGTALEEVVVTAQKRGENLQNVPVAVAAFSADKLKAANISAASDLVNLTPSLRFQFVGPGGTTFLRGIGNSQAFAGSESEVQTYVDGIYYSSAGAAFLRFNNIARIEVDKGPQGTLFGRNATGGVIQIITRDPTQEFTGDASVGYGKYNAKEADLYVSGGVAPRIAADLAMHFDDHDGWGRNITRNTDAFSAQSFAIRSKWIFDFSDTVKGTLIGDYSRDRTDLGVAYVLNAGPWRLQATDPVPAIPPPYTVTDNSPDRTVVERYGASFKLEANLDKLDFVSLTGWRYTYSDGLIDPDGTPASFLIGDETRREKQATQEFQLLSKADSKLKWILGAYLYYNDSGADPQTLSGSLLSVFGASAVDTRSYVNTRSAAGFGQVTYDLTDSTHITAGLRYTYDHRHQNATNTLIGPNGPEAPPPFLPLNINNFPTANFRAPTGKVTISQDISKDAMVYIGYSRGFKSGTFNNFQVLSNPAPALAPEYIDAFEGGFKSKLLDRRLRLNMSAFYYNYSNLQVNEFVSVPVPSIVLQNAAGSKIKGVDADVEFALTQDTHLTAGFGYLDAEYTSFPNAPTYIVNPIGAPNPGGGFGGIVNGVVNAKGKTMPQAPKFSGNVGVNHVIDTEIGTFNLNANLSYQSRVYFVPEDNYSQAPSTLISASAKWTSLDGKFDFTVWGRNLSNEKTISNIQISSVGARGTPNEPLSFGVRLGVHF